MKTFKYKNYKKCYFSVASYTPNPNAMYIEIDNKTYDSITECTTYTTSTPFIPKTAAIKTKELVNFLKELKVVTKVIAVLPYGNFSNKLYLCKIDTDILKEYSKEWHYQDA